MAIAYKSAGAGAATETNGVALAPACPASVAANDILIAHIVVLDNSTSPTKPGDWTLLFGPTGLGTGTPTGRSWVYGKLAAGTEDGSTVSFGLSSGTVGRLGRIYSFDGYVYGAITDVVPAASYSEDSTETDPVIQSVTTTAPGAKAVSLIAQDDNNSHSALGAVTGGTWAEPVADYVDTAVGAQGAALQLQVGTPTSDPGTIAGGTVAGNDDEGCTHNFEIRPSPPTTTGVAKISLASATEPSERTSHAIKVRARVTSGAGTLNVALCEGASNRSGNLTQALTTTLADYSIAIPNAGAEAITSYSNLDIWLWGTAFGPIVFEVDQVWLEAPAAGVPAETGTITATGGGVVTLARSGAHRKTVTATGGGTATLARSSARSRAITATGGGAVTQVPRKGARAAVTATGGGVATTATRKGGRAAVSATGGGVVALAHEAAHVGTVAVTGAGVVTLAASTARSATLAVTGGGSATIAAAKAAEAALGATGAGAASVASTSARSTSATATGGGTVTLVAGSIEQHQGTLAITGSGTVSMAWVTSRRTTLRSTGAGSVTTSASHQGARLLGLTGSGGVGITWAGAHAGNVLVSGGGVVVFGRRPFDWLHAHGAVTLSLPAAASVSVSEPTAALVTVSSILDGTATLDGEPAGVVTADPEPAGVVS